MRRSCRWHAKRDAAQGFPAQRRGEFKQLGRKQCSRRCQIKGSSRGSSRLGTVVDRKAYLAPTDETNQGFSIAGRFRVGQHLGAELVHIDLVGVERGALLVIKCLLVLCQLGRKEVQELAGYIFAGLLNSDFSHFIDRKSTTLNYS